mmetsp:Transcript_31870/g.65990  ORF Transcript_31870/g.65990 Transcript_31870/m.65990 type:complete len:125 (+) Transcript_31870:93-467(+)
MIEKEIDKGDNTTIITTRRSKKPEEIVKRSQILNEKGRKRGTAKKKKNKQQRASSRCYSIVTQKKPFRQLLRLQNECSQHLYPLNGPCIICSTERGKCDKSRKNCDVLIALENSAETLKITEGG